MSYLRLKGCCGTQTQQHESPVGYSVIEIFNNFTVLYIQNSHNQKSSVHGHNFYYICSYHDPLHSTQVVEPVFQSSSIANIFPDALRLLPHTTFVQYYSLLTVSSFMALTVLQSAQQKAMMSFYSGLPIYRHDEQK